MWEKAAKRTGGSYNVFKFITLDSSHDQLLVDWQSYGFIIAGKRGYLVQISQKGVKHDNNLAVFEIVCRISGSFPVDIRGERRMSSFLSHSRGRPGIPPPNYPKIFPLDLLPPPTISLLLTWIKPTAEQSNSNMATRSDWTWNGSRLQEADRNDCLWYTHICSDTILAFQNESSLKSKKTFGGIILKQALWVKYYYPQLGIVLCYH